MDHSLGALLAQNDDQGREQAIYYLSRTMITPVQPDREGMFGVGVRCSENATLFGKPNNKRHLKSQPLEVTHDKAVIIKRPAGKMGHIAIPI